MIRKVLHKQYKPPTDTPDCRFMCRIAFEKIVFDFFFQKIYYLGLMSSQSVFGFTV